MFIIKFLLNIIVKIVDDFYIDDFGITRLPSNKKTPCGVFGCLVDGGGLPRNRGDLCASRKRLANLRGKFLCLRK